MAKKVLILAGDCVEAQEIFYPYYRLREEGVEVKVAAPTKKPLQTVVHDFVEGVETYVESKGYRFPWVDVSFKEVNPEEFDGVLIPGGRAPEYIRLSPELERIIRYFMEKNKPVGAICHGAIILSCYGLIKGRRLTSYSAVRPDIEAAGGEYVDAEVVVDGNLVTSRAWPDLPAWMREFMKLLRT